ncbi:DUF1837 domain-containing protein [Fructilactobacillus myrtifloralis]|uniref:DUF1837 domain-containing protein n=1 Tax=Fructilactobacillus myrtifloralis TaxID=2940301 RepID=A0ABY5BRE1_9LACO|nr:DUF1837 domain-containing protein [Fructilactobacillus myrtifloralis]USS85612.1 DUF1837 domain-containing protein [Fructilactobacillus myrtifloralis]
MCRKTINLINSFKYVGSLYVFKDEPIETEIKIYSPSILNKRFDYEYLINQLVNINIYYSLTYDEVKRLKENDDFGSLSKLARSKFRDSSENDGEGGEILLYSFLEGDLKAPKILSKMPLKTNSNHYVFGADGVHFLKMKTKSTILFMERRKCIKISPKV